MQLRHIKTKECPICKCTTIISESIEKGFNGKIRLHTCGQQWELREFLCGKKIRWAPNFSQECQEGYCGNDPNYIEALKKIEKLRQTQKDLDDLIRTIMKGLNSGN